MPIYGFSYHKLVQTSLFFSPDPLERDALAVLALDQGQVLGKVVSGPHEDHTEDGSIPAIVRRASTEDLLREEENQVFGKRAAEFWKTCVARRKLEMKLVDVEVFLDRTKLVFYFTASSRVDFRELVKDMVHEYRVRIEFRQIGVRHETQMIGALGNCGMVCCCRRYLQQFAPVTIRMAKEQDLFLNPTKVSGICGRLLCCLAYEQENYEKFHSAAPRPGKRYALPDGTVCKVVRTNMFQNSVTAMNQANEELRFTLEEWNDMSPVRQEGGGGGRDNDHWQSPLQKYGQELEGEFPEDDVPGHKNGKGGKAKPKKQTFVTGRVSSRQQGGKGKEVWKKNMAVAQGHAPHGQEQGPAGNHGENHGSDHGEPHAHHEPKPRTHIVPRPWENWDGTPKAAHVDAGRGRRHPAAGAQGAFADEPRPGDLPLLSREEN